MRGISRWIVCSTIKILPVAVVYLAIIGLARVDINVMVIQALSGPSIVDWIEMDYLLVMVVCCSCRSGRRGTCRQGVHMRLGGTRCSSLGGSLGSCTLVLRGLRASSGGGGSSVVGGT